MPSPTISDPRFSVCATRQHLLCRGELLRSEAKIELDRTRAAVLANTALDVQKRRDQHEEHRMLCRRIEPQRAVAV
jgi:hypothetical protein